MAAGASHCSKKERKRTINLLRRKRKPEKRKTTV